MTKVHESGLVVMRLVLELRNAPEVGGPRPVSGDFIHLNADEAENASVGHAGFASRKGTPGMSMRHACDTIACIGAAKEGPSRLESRERTGYDARNSSGGSGLSPIFVVGTPRSGTTLTAKILGRHSAIFMPGETHFFEDIFNRRKELGPASAPEVQSRLRTLYGRYNEPEDQKRVERLLRETVFGSQLRAASSYDALFQRFMEFQMHAVGKRRWGNNTPRELFDIDTIMHIFPDARVIVCVRDVRDFLASYRDNWRNVPEERARRIRAIYHPVVTSLLWRSSMHRLAKAMRYHGNNILVIRYEDLVRLPEVKVAELCHFVGEPFEPDMLNVTSHNSSAALGGSGIFASSVGRWVNSLSAEEVFVAERIAGLYLAQFCYERAWPHPRGQALAATFLSAPFALIRALRANRDKRGPLLPYLFRRVGALIGRGWV